MNRTLYLAVLMCLPITALQSAPQQLPTINVQAENETPHLTTRIQWIKFPQLQYQSADLANQDRSAIVRVYADKTGNVIKSDIQESTGLKALDQKLVSAVRNAKVKPHIKDGAALDIIGFQTFTLKVDDSEDKRSNKNNCTYTFASKNWLKQENNKSVPFKYTQQPSLQLDESLLKGQDRLIKFKFKVNKHGEVSRVKLKKRSGINALDQHVIDAISNVKIITNRSYKTLWIYKKSTLNDEIQFKLDECR
ncbi:TonB family protein [Acinetobacter silvestris]|uniref:TonB-dependent receptor n=1 Tax=Acinetobacter silvestris TaxID=1977882 RepID=A0A1Y3CNV5_9GAMM|nr:TonB family protein [Acinetobacter silvestris]OTG67306.1 TonB-dependent receptor [Acinetobacter silvestris]